MAEATLEDKLNALTTLRKEMLDELGNEYVSGMNQAFKIGISGLEKSMDHPSVISSGLASGMAMSIDILKELQKESIKTFSEVNRNILKNTVTETNGENANG